MFQLLDNSVFSQALIHTLISDHHCSSLVVTSPASTCVLKSAFPITAGELSLIRTLTANGSWRLVLPKNRDFVNRSLLVAHDCYY